MINKALVIVNESIITQADLDQQISIARLEFSASGRAPPPDSVLSSQVLEEMIVDNLLLDVAQRFGSPRRVFGFDDMASAPEIARASTLDRFRNGSHRRHILLWSFGGHGTHTCRPRGFDVLSVSPADQFGCLGKWPREYDGQNVSMSDCRLYRSGYRVGDYRGL